MTVTVDFRCQLDTVRARKPGDPRSGCVCGCGSREPGVGLSGAGWRAGENPRGRCRSLVLGAGVLSRLPPCGCRHPGPAPTGLWDSHQHPLAAEQVLGPLGPVSQLPGSCPFASACARPGFRLCTAPCTVFPWELRLLPWTV